MSNSPCQAQLVHQVPVVTAFGAVPTLIRHNTIVAAMCAGLLREGEQLWLDKHVGVPGWGLVTDVTDVPMALAVMTDPQSHVYTYCSTTAAAAA